MRAAKVSLKRQAGSVSLEWTLATLVMLVALFVPLPGADRSLMALFMDALRGFYMNTSYLLSLP